MKEKVAQLPKTLVKIQRIVLDKKNLKSDGLLANNEE